MVPPMKILGEPVIVGASAHDAEAGEQGAEAQLVWTTPHCTAAFPCSPLFTLRELRRFSGRRVRPKRLDAPSRALRPGLVRALHELQQGHFGRGAVAYLFVQQQRRAAFREPARGLRIERMFGQTFWLGGSVRVEGRLAHASISRPEAEGDNLMGVRLESYRIGVLRQRHLFAGEAGDGEVEAVPVELDGAGLSVKTSGELVEDSIHPREYPMIAPYILPVAAAVEGIVIEGLLVAEVERLRIYGGAYTKRAQPIEQSPVELRHRQVIEGEGERTFVARGYGEAVLEQVEGDVEGRVSVGDGACGEAAGGNVESSVPPVVFERREPHSHLAHYLAVAVQRPFSIFPFTQRQRRQFPRRTVLLLHRVPLLTWSG